jgi:hypothetical protein
MLFGNQYIPELNQLPSVEVVSSLVERCLERPAPADRTRDGLGAAASRSGDSGSERPRLARLESTDKTE